MVMMLIGEARVGGGGLTANLFKTCQTFPMTGFLKSWFVSTGFSVYSRHDVHS